MRRLHSLSVSALLGLSFAVLLPDFLRAASPDFERDIQPLLARCVQCHGPSKERGGLRWIVARPRRPSWIPAVAPWFPASPSKASCSAG